jgi:hypothetical protein
MRANTQHPHTQTDTFVRNRRVKSFKSNGGGVESGILLHHTQPILAIEIVGTRRQATIRTVDDHQSLNRRHIRQRIRRPVIAVSRHPRSDLHQRRTLNERQDSGLLATERHTAERMIMIRRIRQRTPNHRNSQTRLRQQRHTPSLHVLERRRLRHLRRKPTATNIKKHTSLRLHNREHRLIETMTATTVATRDTDSTRHRNKEPFKSEQPDCS